MINRTLLAVLISLLAACAEHPLPVATGSVRMLNVGKWTPGPGDLEQPAPAAPARSS